MNLSSAKRLASFVLYWVPASIIILLKIPIPHYFFLALPLPYYMVALYLINKTPEEERHNADYTRVVLITVSHLLLYYLMFY